MQDIFGMGFGQLGIQIDQYQLVGFAFERDGKGAGATNKTATHNSDLHQSRLSDRSFFDGVFA
jgi:hypothetical protein